MGTKIENTLFVGDQLFTDVYGAKKSGNPQHFGKAYSSKRGDSDCLETETGENCLVFYAKEQRKRKKS